MEVVVKENPANKPMKYEAYVLGQIVAPDSHPVPELYSHIKASKQFNGIMNDIYEGSKKEDALDRKKTPASVYCILGLASILGVIAFARKLIKK